MEPTSETTGEPGTDPIEARRYLLRQVVKLVAVVGLAYFAGVGINFAMGRSDPWIHGAVPGVITLGSSLIAWWRAHRARRNGK
ncbi:hypothetical protein [Amycolatopsis sp. PS_44_ISF1]|uniref:hypothetical protein n=1 Tax=Amycolatopsis sp. PS_44_ISF1 TaxID=2974917 RepID=UPI0028DE0F9C|nr:hypothetical protein [Amycolatopsis sp. PS_44_ISF1]MDT8912578.1 hypothetical protein [Amycolatopsis sp. PS_44_ISF1]